MGAIVTFKKPSSLQQERIGPSHKYSNRSPMTEARIETALLPGSGSRYDYDLDVPGLALRVTANGVRTFVVVKKISGRDSAHYSRSLAWP